MDAHGSKNPGDPALLFGSAACDPTQLSKSNSAVRHQKIQLQGPAADRHDYLRTGSAGSMSHRIGRAAGAHQIPGGGSSREYSKKNDVLALSRVGLISFRGGLIRGSSCARRPKLSAKRICRIYVLTDLIDGICQIAACRALDLGLSCLPGTSAACLARSPCKRPLRGQAPDRHAPASDSVDAIDPHMH